MKNTIILLVVVLLIKNNPLFAQGVLKHLERGNAYDVVRSYAKAIPEYEKYLRSNNSDVKCELRLAECYRKVNLYEKAEDIYSDYFSVQPANDTLLLKYTEVLKRQGKYAEARNQYARLSDKFPRKNQCITACDSFLYSSTQPLYSVENLFKMNSTLSDVAPVWYKKGLVFSSNREETLIKKKSSNSEFPLYNLLYAEGEDSLYPERVSNFSVRINTIHHECCASFTADYKKIFFTKSIDKPYNNDAGSKNALKMYSASWENNNWTDWQTFVFNDTTHSYGHPSVDGNEELFFFVSDMEGGYGGTDIYVCFNIDHKWTKPINLGPHVNSPYNDMYPFYHADGTLFFSSDRPEGMGGYDIYSATENEDGDYEFVRNIGAPVNSSQDDLSIYWNNEKTLGYFASNRPGGKGEEDIYIIKRKK
ncbi:MAG TPA: tetratricopeptide repeat protein [Cytophagaceae bacterium]|jgi:tetratricopeptide (TPR) repeat protein|nr:tetratricopeptide repeat protein [Cytophagaceae bacterium]